MAAEVSGEAVMSEVRARLDEVVRLDDFYVACASGRETWLQDFTCVDLYGKGGVHETPLVEGYSSWDGVRVFEKDDTRQPTGAFKVRGAFVAGTLALQANPGIQRLVTYSAGNHGLAVAHFGEWCGERNSKELAVDVFCIEALSAEKERRLRAYDGVTLHQKSADGMSHCSLEEAEASARRFADEQEGEGAHLIEPFDEPAVAGGQSTALLETMAQLWRRGIDTRRCRLRNFVAGGGFGLANGSAVVMQTLIEAGLVLPGSEVVAVQMEDCDAQRRALQHASGTVDLNTLFVDEAGRDTFDGSADGTAVRRPGPRSLALSRLLQQSGVLRVTTVTRAELGATMTDALARGATREPAGALAEAGKRKDEAQRARYRAAGNGVDDPELVVHLASGANVSAQTLDEFTALAEYQSPRTVIARGATTYRGALVGARR